MITFLFGFICGFIVALLLPIIYWHWKCYKHEWELKKKGYYYDR